MAKSLAEIQKKYARNLAGSGDTVKEGVRNVTVSPTEKAAQAIDRYVQGVMRSAQDGTTAAALREVSLSEWQKDMIEKGIPRMMQAAPQAAIEHGKFMAAFMPHVEAGQRKLESMPRGDFSQNIQRMVANAEHNKSFKYNKR